MRTKMTKLQNHVVVESNQYGFIAPLNVLKKKKKKLKFTSFWKKNFFEKINRRRKIKNASIFLRRFVFHVLRYILLGPARTLHAFSCELVCTHTNDPDLPKYCVS